MELAQFEQAENQLIKSIELDENSNLEKYCLLGQILKGYKSLEQFEKAYLKQLDKQNQMNINTEKFNYNIDFKINELIKPKLCKTIASISELYMTDLCNDENAKDKCNFYLQKGFEIDSKNITISLKYQNITGDINKSRELFLCLFDDINNNLLANKHKDTFDITEYDYNEDILVEISRESLYVENCIDMSLKITEFVLEMINERNFECLYFMAQLMFKTKEYLKSEGYILEYKSLYENLPDKDKQTDEIKYLNSALDELYDEINEFKKNSGIESNHISNEKDNGKDDEIDWDDEDEMID